jgi:hypothetical protein
MADRQQTELTRLGYLGLIPFVAGAIGVWQTPLHGVSTYSPILANITLTYGGIIAAYMAGMSAGAMVAAPKKSGMMLLPGMIAALAAWVAIWPTTGIFDLDFRMRVLLIVVVLIYLLLRDLRSVRAGELPKWYSSLRIQLTSIACLSLASVFAWTFSFEAQQIGLKVGG